MAGNLPLSLVTVDDVVWDQLVHMDAPLGSPVSITVAGVAPVQTWEYTEQVLPDIGDVDAKLLAAAGLSNTILISTTTAEVLETITVSIGENGNWFVGNTDTGVVASGTSPNTIARPTGMYRASLITQAGNLLTIAAGAQFVTSAGGQYLQFSTTADTVITLNTETTLLTIDSDGVIREYPASANLWLIPESEAVVAIAVDSAATVKTFVMPTVHNAWVVAGASRTFAELAQSAALTAESFATAAGNQAVAAEVSASRAEEWASKPENSAITGNPSKYSALHWAMKAQQWASVVGAALIWKGAWSVTMGMAPPTPAVGEGSPFYRISSAGTINSVTYEVGDYIHWDTIGLGWFKIDGTDAVTSVNGKSGAVILNSADVGAQPADATLTALTNQMTAADRLPYFTGVDTAALTPLTAFARSLLYAADADAARNTLTVPVRNLGNLSGMDCNLLIEGGMHRLGSSPVNAPPGNWGYGNLLVIQSSDTLAQMIFDYLSSNVAFRVGNPPEIGGEGSWQPWRMLYHAANIIGTVSQSSGLPTGAIIERGSNANGEYTKFADGSLFCMQRFNLDAGIATVNKFGSTSGNGYAAADTWWTFPHSFVVAPFTWSNPEGLSDHGGASAHMSNVTATSGVCRFWANISGVFGVCYFALGRWF